MNERGYIGGLPVDGLNRSEFLGMIADWLAKPDKPRQIVTLNANMLMKAFKNSSLHRAIVTADLVMPDGIGIVRALRQENFAVERVTGVELTRDLLDYAAERELSVYFYGGSLQVVRRLEIVLPVIYPGLHIRAIRDGYGLGCTEQSVVRELQSDPPNLLIVGLGTPGQEIFIHELRVVLRKTIGIGVGGALDVLAGLRDEAPDFMRRRHLEWMFRMIQDPRRFNRLPDLVRFWVKYLH